MHSGTVKFFNKSKGFGSIVDNLSGQEVFVHESGLVDNIIEEGDRVTFNIEEGKGGKKNAVDVKLAK